MTRPLSEGVATNTATVSAAETDISTADNAAASQTLVVPPAPGRVPDGGAVPGVPLSVRKSTTLPGALDLSWGASCSPQASDYGIHEGALGSWYSHAAKVCSTGGMTSRTLTPGAGGRYYLVVPLSGDSEGSYGVDSAGNERPRSTQSCAAAQNTAPCE